MRPPASCTAALRNASIVHATTATPTRTYASAALSKGVPQQPLFPVFSAPLQGHHHQRFVSTSTRLYHGLVKVSPLQSMTASSVSARAYVVAGTATACVFGPLIWSRTFGSFRNVAHCASGTPPNPDPAKIPGNKEPLIKSQELTFGTAMGLCSGYLLKKLGKMFVLVAGLGFVSLQLLANSGYISVNWMKVESKFKEQLDLDKDGQVTVKDAKYGFNWIIDVLTRNFQFRSTFAGGFYVGFRYG
ncbi:FUN14 domain-containing protein 1 [Dissophora globulifera]|uniref:FUN14 domain-containing protein 1 n=1 Tax=Dissophora globulifera TaxID=979702 RepID=A0A9P6RQG6_9FUNG|nr:FUN14 domain-containing protein 1 [Dissophora globulifera]